MKPTSGNKLIAEFMGFELEKTLRNEFVYAMPGKNRTTDFFALNELKYHLCWDWLMPVVEKIELSLPEDNVVTIAYKDCCIPFLGSEIDIITNGETKILAVWKAVVQFIELFNEKTHKT